MGNSDDEPVATCKNKKGEKCELYSLTRTDKISKDGKSKDSYRGRTRHHDNGISFKEPMKKNESPMKVWLDNCE